MQARIDELLNQNDYVLNRFQKIYSEVFSNKNEKDYLLFQYLIENSLDIDVNQENEIPVEASATVKKIGNLYYNYLKELIDVIAQENYCKEEFYQRLYRAVFESDLIKLTDAEYGIVLYFLAMQIKGLPYYQAINAIRLSDEQFENAVNKIAPSIEKGLYMLDGRFGYNTEIASQLCDISDKLEDRTEKTVFWAVIIGTLRDKKRTK